LNAYGSPVVAALPLVKAQQETRKANNTAVEPFNRIFDLNQPDDFDGWPALAQRQ
jgi:hypothetical protein